jgi:hypothetical protein
LNGFAGGSFFRGGKSCASSSSSSSSLLKRDNLALRLTYEAYLSPTTPGGFFDLRLPDDFFELFFFFFLSLLELFFFFDFFLPVSAWVTETISVSRDKQMR